MRVAVLAALALPALSALPALARPLHAQEPRAAADTVGGTACRGEIVSAIEITTLPPPVSRSELAWRVMTSTVAFAYEPTHADVVAGLVQLREGEPCTEVRRTESERILRAQPFIAAARVRAVPDGAGRVRITIGTVDEVPALVRVRLGGLTPEAVTLGAENIGGRARSLAFSAERGGAYRDGFGISMADFAVLGGPYTAAIEAERRPLGSVWGVSLERPFYTALQSTAWRLSVRSADDYRRLVRPDGDPLALRVRQIRWEAGGMHRRRLFGESGFAGLALIGVRDSPAQEGVLVTDSGLVADDEDVLRGRYARFRVVRPVGFVGARMLRFVPVQGFNTLRAEEDLAAGVQVGGLLGRGVPAWGASDVYLAGSLYAAHVTPRSMLGVQVEIEGRRDFEVHDWNGLVASGRVAWYRRHATRRTLVVSDEISGGTRAQLPLQLTLGDRLGGLRGHRRSLLAGAWRHVLRVEERRVRRGPVFNTDLGLAAFAEAATLWAGTAPYGRNVPIRGSVGLGLLAAYPSGSGRLARLDVVVPTHRDGNRAWELRATLTKPRGRFWQEPVDVTRARTGPVPSSMFSWLVR